MYGERTCCAGLTIEIGEEAHTLLARRENGGCSFKEIEEFRMFVGPGLGANIRP
jgi:hypothetical protein